MFLLCLQPLAIRPTIHFPLPKNTPLEGIERIYFAITDYSRGSPQKKNGFLQGEVHSGWRGLESFAIPVDYFRNIYSSRHAIKKIHCNTGNNVCAYVNNKFPVT